MNVYIHIPLNMRNEPQAVTFNRMVAERDAVRGQKEKKVFVCFARFFYFFI